MGIGPFVIVADALPSKLQNKLLICNETKISKLWSLILVNHYFWHYNRVSTVHYSKKSCQYEIGIFSRFPTFFRIVNTLQHDSFSILFFDNSCWHHNRVSTILFYKSCKSVLKIHTVRKSQIMSKNSIFRKEAKLWIWIFVPKINQHLWLWYIEFY